MKEMKRIGIIAAMDAESDGIKAAIKDPKTETVGGIVFVSGTIGEKEVVVARCGVGKVFAAMCAQAMILHFAPDCIINTGIAGGLAKELKIFDCVVADCVVQHDMDTSAVGDPVGLISGINVIEIYTDKTVSAALAEAVDNCGITRKSGKVATGDRFVAGNDERARINEFFGADCCEMEGGAVGQVCYVNEVPFGIIRTISDSYGEEEPGMDFIRFAKKAAEDSVKLVLEFLKII